MPRLTTGDEVAHVDGRTGTIVQDDHDSQPYNVLWDDDGDTTWVCEEAVMRKSSSGGEGGAALERTESVTDPKEIAKLAKKMALTPEDLQELFGFFDKEGNGFIHPKEFRTLLAALGVPLSEQMAAAVVKHLDKDGDGKIGMGEFVPWFVAQDWSLELQDEDFDKKYLQSSAFIDDMPKEFFYDWDYSLSEEENIKLSIAAQGDRKAETLVTESYGRNEVLEEQRKMLLVQLLVPFWIKKGLKMVDSSGASDPNGKSQNSFTLAVGEPTPRGSLEAFARPVSHEAFAATSPPDKRSGSVLCADFSVREGANEADLEEIAATLNKMFQDLIVPLIPRLPKEIAHMGVMSGSLFEALKIGVEEVDGKKVFRIKGFLGVDPVALIKDSLLDLHQLLPTLSCKLTTGFGLADLLGEATLRDMLTGKLELTVDWHVKLAEVAARVITNITIMTDDYRRKKSRHQQCVILAAIKFFQAQRSLLYVQFESVCDALCEIIKGLDLGTMLMQGPLEELADAGVFEGPPSPEVIAAVLDALCNISGKTFKNLRTRFLAEFYLPIEEFVDQYISNSPMGLPMDTLKMALKGFERKLVKAVKDDDQKDVKIGKAFLGMIRVYFKAQASLTGFVGAKAVCKAFEAGVAVAGLGDVFEVLASYDEFNATEHEGPVLAEALKMPDEDDNECLPGPEWVGKYVESMEGWLQGETEGPTRPSEEYLAGLREDFSELIDVIKAAQPFLESANRENLDMPPEMVKSVEDEAKMMFGLV